VIFDFDFALDKAFAALVLLILTCIWYYLKMSGFSANYFGFQLALI